MREKLIHLANEKVFIVPGVLPFQSNDEIYVICR
ncbi:hypothetical protein SDC9_134568 [bioreactor metagenome]|uniref:Uncharacterized protein n=1 Tax=bioreactor metagenome TaxID=1076179 RepID=A0A645DFX0_9ZZZZ